MSIQSCTIDNYEFGGLQILNCQNTNIYHHHNIEYILIVQTALFPPIDNMNENQPSSLQYQISLNSFKDEISHKLMILEKMQYEITSKLKIKYFNNNQITCQIVKYCRKNIEEIQRMFADVRSYFYELKIQFVYQLVFAIFRVIVFLVKVLSQRFVTTIKDRKKQATICQSSCSFNKKTERLIDDLKNKNITEIQYFDCFIKNIQMDEKRLDEKKRLFEQNIFFLKDSVENINPSDAVNQLQTLKKHFDRIISISEKLGSEGSINKNQENFKYLRSFRKPEQIQDEYCNNIAQKTKQKFFCTMQNVAKRLYLNIRSNEKQEMIKQIINSRPVYQSKQTQTCQFEAKNKMDNMKDKGVLIMQNQSLRKANTTLKKQLVQLNSEIQKLQSEHKQLQKKTQIASDMLNKKMMQLQKAKTDFEYNLNKKDQTIEALNKKIVEIKSQRAPEWTQSHVEVSNFEPNNPNNLNESMSNFDESVEEDCGSKLKIPTKERAHHTSFYYQKQFKLQRQQNNHLRKSLTIMLDALREQKLILEYPISDLNNDLRLGKLISKIEAISIQLLKKVKQIKLKDQPKQQDSNRSKIKKKTSILPWQMAVLQKNEPQKKIVINCQTQTIDVAKSVNKFSPYHGFSHQKPNENMENKKDNKLQVLKKQLINRISTGRNAVISPTRSRPFLHEIQGIKHVNNISFQNIKSVNQQENSRRISKNKIIFNRKDISFEEFKINPQQNKSHYAEKKIMHKAKKSHDNLKNLNAFNHESLNGSNRVRRRMNNRSHENQFSQNLSLIQQNPDDCNKQQILNEVVRIVNTFESKREKKSEVDFIKKLIKELKKIKQKQIIQQILMDKENDLGFIPIQSSMEKNIMILS